VRQAGKVVGHQSYHLDSHGNKRGQAMARLVSLPVSLAVESVLNDEIVTGVSAAPELPSQINKWISALAEHGDKIGYHNHLDK
jgi:saccharopine dehydrogenase (NADP+, L-glutamate forming)